MPAIPYAADGRIWTAENLNDLYAEADRKAAACLTDKSLFMARRWTMSGLPLGRIVAFTATSSVSPRRMASPGIWAVAGSAPWPAAHNQAQVATEVAKFSGGLSGFGFAEFNDGDRNISYRDRYMSPGGYAPAASPNLEVLMGSMIPVTVDVGGEPFSLGVGIEETTPAGKVSVVNQGGAAGFNWHFRAHPLAVAELCFDGVTSQTIPATWTRFGLFRVHNLQHRSLTITFEAAVGAPGGNAVLTLAPWESRAVRRLADGSLLHEWAPGVPCRYFWPYVSGDVPFWRAGGGNAALGSTLAALSPEATLAASNLGNVSLLVEWFNALGQEMDPSVAPDISGVYGGFFGHPSTGKMGDLAHQFGRIQRVQSVSGVWTLQADAFVSDAGGVATALSTVGATTDGSSNRTMPTGHYLDGPGCSVFGNAPSTGIVWPATAPDVLPHDAHADFLPGWQLWTFTTASGTGGWRTASKTSAPATFSSTFTTEATAVASALAAVATVSGWTLTPFGWSLQVTQSIGLQSGFDLVPLGSVFDTISSSTIGCPRRLWFTPGRDGADFGTFPSLSGPAVVPPGAWPYLLQTAAQNSSSNDWAEWSGGKWIGEAATADASVTPQAVSRLGDRNRLISPPSSGSDGRKALPGDPVAAYRHPSSGAFPLPSGSGGAVWLRIPLSKWQWDVLAYVVNAWTRGTLQVDWFDFPIRYQTSDGATGNSGPYSDWMPLARALEVNFEHQHNTLSRPSGDALFYRVPNDGVFRVNSSITSEWGMTVSTYTRTTASSDQTTTISRSLSYVTITDFLSFMAGQGLYGFGIRDGSCAVYEPLVLQFPVTTPPTYFAAGTLDYEGENDGLVTWSDPVHGGAATDLRFSLRPLNVLTDSYDRFGPQRQGGFLEDGFLFLESLPAGCTSFVRVFRDRYNDDFTSSMESVSVTPSSSMQSQGNSRGSYGVRDLQTVNRQSFVAL